MGDARPLGRPESYGVANKRLDCREQKSRVQPQARARRPRSPQLFGALPAPWLLVSVNDEGFHDPGALRELLDEHGHVGRIDVEGNRYVGAQIGIHNPAGEKVGSVSHLRNREHLFLVGPDRALVESVVAEASPAPAAG